MANSSLSLLQEAAQKSFNEVGKLKIVANFVFQAGVPNGIKGFLNIFSD